MELIRTRERFSFFQFMGRHVIRNMVVHPFGTILVSLVFALSLGTLLRHHVDAPQRYYKEAASLVKEFPGLRGDLKGYCADGKLTVAEFSTLKSKAKGLRTERMISEPEK
jgi:hypothetical protein